MFIDRLNVIGLKTETNAYVADTLTGADYNFRADKVKCSPSIEEVKRVYASGDYGKFTSIMGKRSGKISFELDLDYSGTAVTPPEWGKIFKSCGFKETVGGANVTYIPDSSYNNVPCTIEYNYTQEGTSPKQVIVKLKGCMGQIKLSLDAVGHPLKATVDFEGVLVSVTDRVSAIMPSGYDATNPDGVLASTITCNFGAGAQTQDLDKVDIDFGNKLGMAVDPANSSGLRGAYIVDRDPKLKLDPHMNLVADRNYYTNWTAGTTGVFSMTVGSHLTLTAPAIQIIKGYDGANRNGFVVNTLDCILTRTSAAVDNCFTITHS